MSGGFLTSSSDSIAARICFDVLMNWTWAQGYLYKDRASALPFMQAEMGRHRFSSVRMRLLVASSGPMETLAIDRLSYVVISAIAPGVPSGPSFRNDVDASALSCYAPRHLRRICWTCGLSSRCGGAAVV